MKSHEKQRKNNEKPFDPYDFSAPFQDPRFYNLCCKRGGRPGPHGAQKAAPWSPTKGPKKGDQRKGTIFIDGPSMNSLMEIHWYSLMVSNNEYRWISSSLKSSSLKKPWTNYEKPWKTNEKQFKNTMGRAKKGPRKGPKERGPKERGPYSLMDHQWIHWWSINEYHWWCPSMNINVFPVLWNPVSHCLRFQCLSLIKLCMNE